MLWKKPVLNSVRSLAPPVFCFFPSSFARDAPIFSATIVVVAHFLCLLLNWIWTNAKKRNVWLLDDGRRAAADVGSVGVRESILIDWFDC